VATEAPKPRYSPRTPSARTMERAMASPDLAGGGGGRAGRAAAAAEAGGEGALLVPPALPCLPLLSMIISRWLTTSTGTVKNCVTKEATAPPTALAAPAFCGSERRGSSEEGDHAAELEPELDDVAPALPSLLELLEAASSSSSFSSLFTLAASSLSSARSVAALTASSVVR